MATRRESHNPAKKVSKENLETILESARLAPTFSGLQPSRVVIVENQELKEKMVKGALNPEVMRDCSHVLVFAAWDSYSEEKIDKVYDHHSDVHDLPRGRFSDYTDKIKTLYNSQTAEQHFAHTARQTYIALV
jgi:nitroreductase/dihydropteridine reductase